MDPEGSAWHPIHCSYFFLIFWLLSSYFWIDYDIWNWTLKPVPTITTITPQIFMIFQLLSGSFWIDYHIWNWSLVPENSTHNPLIYFWFFGYFIWQWNSQGTRMKNPLKAAGNKYEICNEMYWGMEWQFYWKSRGMKMK